MFSFGNGADARRREASEQAFGFQHLLWVLLAWSLPHQVVAVEPTAEFRLDSAVTNNLFLDTTREGDLVHRPAAELGLDLSDNWSLGYHGEFSNYLSHPELRSHFHQLFAAYNPQWGTYEGDELYVALLLDTLRNQADYASLNNLHPSLVTNLAVEPRHWMRFQLAHRLAYRWYYDATASDTVDAWLEGKATITLPSRTTLSPFFFYGFRSYPGMASSSANNSDNADRQSKLGITMSQGLWHRAGLRLRYEYTSLMGDGSMLLQGLTDEQYTLLGEEFLYSGHRLLLGFKHIFSRGLTLDLSGTIENRRYGNWPQSETDAPGDLRQSPFASRGRFNNTLLNTELRHDIRLVPSASLSYLHEFDDIHGSWLPAVQTAFYYSSIFQRSSYAWYSTSAHTLALSMTLLW